MTKHVWMLLVACVITISAFAERVDMKQAGAKTDGKSLNTQLINSTITRLSEAGGGTLFFPSGTYLTGSIHLKSNITLELEAGATLLFSTNFDDFLPFVEVRHEGVMMKSFSPLLFYSLLFWLFRKPFLSLCQFLCKAHLRLFQP